MHANEITSRSTYLEICRVLWFAPTGAGWGVSATVKGEPGVSKTALAEWAAHTLGLGHVEEINYGEVGEAYAGVMPVVDTVENTVAFPCPQWVQDVQALDRCLVFLDETTTDSPDLRKSGLQIMHGKKVSRRHLGTGVRVMGACNPEGKGGTETRDFAPNEANRTVHLNYMGGTVQEGADYMRGRDVFAQMDGAKPQAILDAGAEESRVRDAWAPAYARACMLVWDGFLRANPDAVHRMPAEHDPASSGAWASRRTWDLATLLLASCEIQGASDETRDLILAGTVGDGVAVALSAYLGNLDLPNPADVLDGRTTWAHDTGRPDVSFVVLRSCVDLATGPDSTPERVTSMWALARQTSAHGADIIIDAVSALIKAKLYRKADKNAAHCAKILAPMLRAAGLTT